MYLALRESANPALGVANDLNAFYLSVFGEVFGEESSELGVLDVSRQTTVYERRHQRRVRIYRPSDENTAIMSGPFGLGGRGRWSDIGVVLIVLRARTVWYRASCGNFESLRRR